MVAVNNRCLATLFPVAGPMSLESCTQLCFNRKLPLASTEYGRNLHVRRVHGGPNASVIKPGGCTTLCEGKECRALRSLQ